MVTWKSILWTKDEYRRVSSLCHLSNNTKHDLVTLIQCLTTGTSFYAIIRIMQIYDIKVLRQRNDDGDGIGIFQSLVYTYGIFIVISTPMFWTAIVHSIFLYICCFPIPTIETNTNRLFLLFIFSLMFRIISRWLFIIKKKEKVSKTSSSSSSSRTITTTITNWILCTVWYIPIAMVDVLNQRHWYLPKFVPRNRTISCNAQEEVSMKALGKWIDSVLATNTNAAMTTKNETGTTTTISLSPDNEPGITDDIVLSLQQHDERIINELRKQFATYHFDIKPVIKMNEILIHVDHHQQINVNTNDNGNETKKTVAYESPYTTDGLFWFLPGVSLYRVIVGVSSSSINDNGIGSNINNDKTIIHHHKLRFKLQHKSIDKMLTSYTVIGYDYNREVYRNEISSVTVTKTKSSSSSSASTCTKQINNDDMGNQNHSENDSNEKKIAKTSTQEQQQRRCFIQLHYIIYPTGWDRYGQFCAHINTFYHHHIEQQRRRRQEQQEQEKQQLQRQGVTSSFWFWSWHILLKFHSTMELFVGWNNFIYVLISYSTRFVFPLHHDDDEDNDDLVHVPFLILTSYRHYLVYITAFGYRRPQVGFGYIMRDSAFFKTIAILHLLQRLVPLIELPRDIPVLLLILIGYSIHFISIARLGIERTYFGTELGFVGPKWISGFPYGYYIPHPMIVSQMFAFGSILIWYYPIMSTESTLLLCGHIIAYTIHMIQEELTSSYKNKKK